MKKIVFLGRVFRVADWTFGRDWAIAIHMLAATRLSRAITVLVVLVLGGCKEPTGPEKPISGEQLFFQHCARCHGVDGKGLPEVSGVRDLTDPQYMGTMSNDQVRRTIQRGKPPNMPAFGRQFAEPSLEVLVAFVRGLSSQPKPATPPQEP